MATQRISFDFDSNEYKYLKMCCAKLGVKLREFASKALIDAIEAQEDKWHLEQLENEPEVEGENFVIEKEGENFILVERNGARHDL